MIDPVNDLKLFPAAANPGNDTATAGGAKGSTAVAGGSPGEIFPRLRALETGIVDTDVNFQLQKAFFSNLSSDTDLLAARAFLKNGLQRPGSTGRVFIVLEHAGDAGKQVRSQIVVGGVLLTEAINTPTATGSGAATQGVQSAVQWIERSQLVDAGTGLQVAAVGNIQIRHGSSIGTSVLLGIIPAPSANGFEWSWATSEVQMLGLSVLNGTSTISNRKAIGDLSGTFVRATTYETGVNILLDPDANILPFGESWAFWGLQTLQPSMPSNDAVQYCWRIQGES